MNPEKKESARTALSVTVDEVEEYRKFGGCLTVESTIVTFEF